MNLVNIDKNTRSENFPANFSLVKQNTYTPEVNYLSRDLVSVSSHLCQHQKSFLTKLKEGFQVLGKQIVREWNALAWYEKPLLLFMFLGVSCAPARNRDNYNLPLPLAEAKRRLPTEVGPLSKKEWTIFIHLSADNSLNDYVAQNIESMIQASAKPGFSANANIVVLWDDYYSQDGYYYINEGKVTYVRDLGELDMGFPFMAQDFIDYSVEHFPADKYAYIIWNHGNGEAGVSYDDTNWTYMSTPEQKDLFSHFSNVIGRKVDLVGYDACLMGAAGIAYELKDQVNYMVASQQLEPAEGWDYAFLANLVNPNVSARDLAKSIVDYYDNKYKIRYSDAAMSAYNLNLIPNFATALNNFCDAVIASGLSPSVYRNCLNGVVAFYGETSERAFDLKQYLSNILTEPSVPIDVKNYAQQLLDIIYTNDGDENNDLVFHIKNGPALSGVGGISVTPDNRSFYQTLDIAIDTKIDEFFVWLGVNQSNL